MWRSTVFAVLLLILCPFAFSQSTVVSGTITDLAGQPWNNGTYSFSFKPNPTNPGPYFFNGVPFNVNTTLPAAGPGQLSAGATLSIPIPPNTSITPAGSTWVVTVTPAASSPAFSVALTITGATLNISSLVIPPPIVVNLSNPVPGVSAYTDGETIGAKTGTSYYNLSDSTIHVCTGFPPCTWVSIGSSASILPSNNTFTGINTFTQTIIGNINGNAATSTTAGSAGSLNAPSLLPNGTTAQTQLCTDITANVATDLYVANCSSGGGGGAPAGNNGDVQIRNGSVFGAGGENDDGTTITVNRGTHDLGPDPWNDVCLHGALCGATASSTTANTVGTTAITVASAASFKDGQGVTIQHAGAAPSITALGSITLTPSLNAGGIRTVAAGAGSTSSSYKVVAVDKNCGYLAATTAVSTTTGNVLGKQPVNITAMSRSGTTVTVATSAPHLFMVGAEVYIQYIVAGGTNSDRTFDGFFLVASVPDSTHFTFLGGYDTTVGATTSDTGGIAIGFTGNTLSWTSVPGAFKYAIYGRTTGGYNLIGQTLDHFWVDYGSPMNDNQTFPSCLPTTAPSSGANDNLTTTIVSGGSTTSLVLASAAGATVTGATIVSDDSPALIADCIVNGPTCYVPQAGIRLNSYTILPGQIKVLMNGPITTNDTLELGPATVVEGWRGGSNLSFAWRGSGASISGSAYPQLSIAGSGVNITNMSIACPAQNGCLQMADYAANPIGNAAVTNFSMDYSTMNTGGGTTSDYLGMNAIFQNDGFGFRFDKDTFGTGSPGTNAEGSIGNTPIPSIVFKNTLGVGGSPTGNFAFTRSWFLLRASVDQDYVSNSGGINYMIFQDIQTQNSFLPQAMITGPGSSAITGQLDVENVTGADFPTAFFANLGGTTGGAARFLQMTPVQGSNANTTGAQMIPMLVWNAGVGQNGNTTAGPAFTNQAVNVMGGGNIGFAMPPPAAPSVAINGASGPPAGTYTYCTAAVDTGNRTSSVGPCSSPITVNGSQGVNVIFGAPSPGQVSTTVCRATGGAPVCATVGAGFQIPGTSFIDNGAFFPNQSANQVNTGAASTVINANGSATFAQKLVGGGFAQTTTGTFTAARAVTAPDLGGIQGLTATLTTCNPLFNAGGLITSTPSVFMVECYAGANPQDQVNNCITAALAVNGACDLGAWTVGHPQTFTDRIVATLTNTQRLTIILPASCDWKANFTGGTHSLFEISGGSVKFDDSRTSQYGCQIQNISAANGLFAFVTVNGATTNYTAVRGLFINNSVATASNFDIMWNGSVDNSYIQNNQITENVGGGTQGAIFVGGGSNTVCCGMFIDHNVLLGNDNSNVLLQITAASNLYSIFVTNNSIGHPGPGKFNFQCTDGSGHVSAVYFWENYEELSRNGPGTVATNSNAGCGQIDVSGNISGAFVASTTSPLWTSTGDNIIIHSAFMHRVTNNYTLPATVLSNSNALSCTSTPCLIKTDSVGRYGEASVGPNFFAGMALGNTTYSSAHTATIFETNIDVTGATTISIDPTLLYSFWNVTNVGAGSVTVAPLSGTINGSASLTLAANAMVTNIHCNGTNCWAKQ